MTTPTQSAKGVASSYRTATRLGFGPAPLFLAAALALYLGWATPRCLAQAPRLAASSKIVVGNARFTVIAPNCIRIEYSPTGRFIDQPSIFAADRLAHSLKFRLSSAGEVTTIDTGAISLTYRSDGRAFDADNLRAVIRRDGGDTIWTPGEADPENLGGTLHTLDGLKGPVDLGQGLLSRSGWALVDDSKSPLLTGDWVEARPKTGETDWYLFGYGLDYRAALSSLAAVSGPVPLPRRYALGVWYSRYWPYSSTEFRQIVRQYAQHDFPLDNMVLDMDWHRAGWTGWSWNRKLLPDAEALLVWLHAQGLHVTLNIHPDGGVGSWEDRYADFMRALGKNPSSGKTVPFDAGSKRYMDALIDQVQEPLEREGVDFWWLDWQQYPFTRSIPDLTNLFWLNTVYYRHSEHDGLRGLSFSRWAGLGDQRHPIEFSGDADTGWPMLAFEVPFTSTAGNVACFFWSNDIGGHEGGRNVESYTRWCQFGAVSAVLRPHSTRDKTMDRRPWTYPKWAEDSMRISFHLRDKLFPYIYTSAWETCRDTVPLLRPMYFDYPATQAAYENPQEFLFGDNLLAAPIATPGTGPKRIASQKVWFPKGWWWGYFTGARQMDDSSRTVSCDIDSFPLYARGGVPIPMQPYTPRMTAISPTTLIVRCYPGPNGIAGRATYYEDDGVTRAYRGGAFATTPLTYLRLGDKITVTIGPASGSYAGKPKERDYIVEIPSTTRAAHVTLDGKPIAATYDPHTHTNTIPLPAGSLALRHVVTTICRIDPPKDAD